MAYNEHIFADMRNRLKAVEAGGDLSAIEAQLKEIGESLDAWHLEVTNELNSILSRLSALEGPAE